MVTTTTQKSLWGPEGMSFAIFNYRKFLKSHYVYMTISQLRYVSFFPDRPVQPLCLGVFPVMPLIGTKGILGNSDIGELVF